MTGPPMDPADLVRVKKAESKRSRGVMLDSEGNPSPKRWEATIRKGIKNFSVSARRGLNLTSDRKRTKPVA